MSKKIKMNICICLIVIVLAVVVTALINFYPILSMTPTETGVIEGTGILSVRNNRNSIFFIQSENGYVIIDAGTNKTTVQETLNELSINPYDIKHVLLTHSDSDHIGSLPLFVGAQVYISEDELQMVNGSTKRSALGYNSLPDNIDISSLSFLSDKQELNLDGISVKCLKSAGHTPGSMSYLVNGKYLFTGDAIRVSGGHLMFHPFTMDEKTAQKSLEQLKIAKEDSTLLFTAHYGYHDSEEVE